MQRSKALALLFFLGAALAGGAVGFTADRVLSGGHDCARDGGQPALRDRLATRLSLTSAQRAAVDTILDGRHRQIQEILAPVRPRMDSVRLAARVQIERILTPEQRVEYEAMLREADEKRASDAKRAAERR